MSRVPTAEDLANWTPYGLPDSCKSGLLLAQNRTDDEAGRRFAREHGNVVRYVATWRKWLTWDGRRWALDDSLAVQSLAKRTNDGVWQEVLALVADQETTQKEATAYLSWGKYLASVKGTENMLTKAESEANIVVRHDQLDRDPWLLNTLNGTIDLRTGKARPHDQADLITKLAPVTFNPAADCPKWCRFIHQIMAGNQALIGYLRKLAGYWLTGTVRDHVLPLFIGKGANGKSVMLNTLQSLWGGDYAMKAPQDLLLAKKGNTHPTELADLCGKRLVCAIEIESGRRLAESLVKELTGGDKIRARRMREDFWEFAPSHKVVMALNHKPVVKGQDNGIWRRLRIVPFDVVFAPDQQNPKLTEELLEELPGILNWCLLGCAEWQTEGLGEPQEVMLATKVYQNESDLIGEFITEKCHTKSTATVPGGLLYDAYKQWCDANGYHVENSTVFGRSLSDRGFESKPAMHGKVRMGIGLIANNSPKA